MLCSPGHGVGRGHFNSSFWCKFWRLGSKNAALSMTCRSPNLSRLAYLRSLAIGSCAPRDHHFYTPTYTGLHGETSRQTLRHHRTKTAQSKEENHANSACMRGRGDVVDRIGRGDGANRGLHGLARRRVRGTGAGLPACCPMASRTAGHRLRLRRRLQLVRRRGTGRARLGLRWLSVLSLPGQRSADHDVRHGDRSAAHHVFARYILGSVLSGASVVSRPGPLGASSAATLPSTAAG